MAKNVCIPPDGLAVDWVNNKIYFTDAGLNIVGVFDPIGFHYRVLVRSDSTAEPRAIVLDPNNRQVSILTQLNLKLKQFQRVRIRASSPPIATRI